MKNEYEPTLQHQPTKCQPFSLQFIFFVVLKLLIFQIYLPKNAVKNDNSEFLPWLIVIDYWFLKSVQNPGVDGAQSAEVVVIDGEILLGAAL